MSLAQVCCGAQFQCLFWSRRLLLILLLFFYMLIQLSFFLFLFLSPVCHLMATAIASLSIQPLHYQQHVHVLHITLCTTSTMLDWLTAGETKQKNMYTATEISRSRFGLQKEYGGKGNLGIAYCEADTTNQWREKERNERTAGKQPPLFARKKALPQCPGAQRCAKNKCHHSCWQAQPSALTRLHAPRPSALTRLHALGPKSVDPVQRFIRFHRALGTRIGLSNFVLGASLSFSSMHSDCSLFQVNSSKKTREK